MKKSRILGVLCAVFFTFASVSANAALVSRLGGAAAWDGVLGITWLTDADLSGSDTWDNQLAWIASLNAENSGAGHLGFNDWRLASMSVSAGVPTGTTTSVVNCSSATEEQCKDNELGYMYYYNLGGSGDNQTGDHTIGDVTLTDVRSDYWSGTEYDSSIAWHFFFGGGFQDVNSKDYNFYGWAVRAGDVGAVPVPAAVWLFGSGLIGLLGLARRKR